MGSTTQGRNYLNARAEDCHAVGSTRGQPTVWFQGEAHFVIGFYFAHGYGGERELHYVLRPVDATGNGLFPLDRKTPAPKSL